MKVNLGTIDVTDDLRRAVRHRYGKSGLATRDEVRRLYLSLADADMQAILSDWEKDTKKERPNA